MKSSSQHLGHPPAASASQSEMNLQQYSSQQSKEGYADRVQCDHISKLLNHQQHEGSASSNLFSQYQKGFEKGKARPKIPRMHSQSSSRATTTNSNNTVGQKGTNQHSTIASKNLTNFSPKEQQSSASNLRSSTQDSKRRRSVKNALLNQSDIAEHPRASKKIHHLSSPSEKIIGKEANKIVAVGAGGRDKTSTERLFMQIVEHRIDQNKENQNGQVVQTSKHKASLPMSIQRSFQSRDDSASQHSSQSMSRGFVDKHMKEVGRQKELLQRLQAEKDELQRQLQKNDKVIQNRMQKLHVERKMMEERIVKATVVIQTRVRGFLARKLLAEMAKEESRRQKEKLELVLREMQQKINNCASAVEIQIEKSVVKIQRAVRKMIQRKNFRISLYKLMLTRNIIENKVHKERMSMLYAFEQLIINTEEGDCDYYDELYGEELPEGCSQGEGFYPPDYFLSGVPMQRIPVEHEYLSNPSDIIDEEEFEESEVDLEEQKLEESKIQEAKPVLQHLQKQKSKVRTHNVVASDILDSNGEVVASNIGFEVATINQTADSQALVPYSDKVTFDQGTQYEPPKKERRPLYEKKPLPLPAPEPQAIGPQRPVDYERLVELSKPKVWNFESEQKKKPASKQIQKARKIIKQKKKQSQPESEGKEQQDQQKPKKRKSSKANNQLSHYQKLWKHRENRKVKEDLEKTHKLKALPSSEPVAKIEQPKVMQKASKPARQQKVPVQLHQNALIPQASYEDERRETSESEETLTNLHIPERQRQGVVCPPLPKKQLDGSVLEEQKSSQKKFGYPRPQKPYETSTYSMNMKHSGVKKEEEEVKGEAEENHLPKIGQNTLDEGAVAQYKKCFPSVSLSFKDRFPLFADIVQKYSKK